LYEFEEIELNEDVKNNPVYEQCVDAMIEITNLRKKQNVAKSFQR